MPEQDRLQPWGVPADMVTKYYQGDYAGNFNMQGVVTQDEYINDNIIGNRFTASYLRQHGSELADDASQAFLVVTDNRPVRMAVEVAVGGNCELRIYRWPVDLSNFGTPIPMYCKNQQVPATTSTGLHVYFDPVCTDFGTLMIDKFLPGYGSVSGLGIGLNRSPWILAPGPAHYVYTVTNRSGIQGGIQYSILFEWSLE